MMLERPKGLEDRDVNLGEPTTTRLSLHLEEVDENGRSLCKGRWGKKHRRPCRRAMGSILEAMAGILDEMLLERDQRKRVDGEENQSA